MNKELFAIGDKIAWNPSMMERFGHFSSLKTVFGIPPVILGIKDLNPKQQGIETHSQRVTIAVPIEIEPSGEDTYGGAWFLKVNGVKNA